MKIFYCDHFVLPLPEGHRFPMSKYAQLRDQVVKHNLIPPQDLCVPKAASDEQLRRSHDQTYVDKIKSGNLTKQEVRRMGFPWSIELVARSRRSVGGTIAASRAALTDGCGVNLAGGTHHAGREHGEGFCVFNDSAVAAKAMQAEGRAKRVIIIDCDVHQGNGTAAILKDDPTVFTFSIHGEKNFPFRKHPSDLDVGLVDGTRDLEYLDALDHHLRQAMDFAESDFAIYLAGADPFEGDRLGRLAISMSGLLERDRIVLEMCQQRGIPTAIVMAGGYAVPVEDTVAVHFQTVKLAAEMHA
ncbi:MAG: histone deacetylase [Chloroflexota bacterium]